MSAIEVIRLQHPSGLRIAVSPLGATWLSCRLPLAGDSADSAEREVLLGCQVDDLPRQSAYLGATVGRYANRIAEAQFCLQGKSYPLSANQANRHTLHGGADNFSYRRWQVLEHGQTRVVFALHSPDGDQGFPAALSATVSYTLEENCVIIDYQADSDGDSICALTNHAYFNLDGAGDARRQSLHVPASHFLPVDSEGIPCAELTSVAVTPFDFRQAKPLARDFTAACRQAPVGGYDHSWYLGHNGEEKLAAQLHAADERLTLSLYTTQPALHVYSGNFLAGTPNRQSGVYDNFAGIALETGCLPNSPNLPAFASDCHISPAQAYRHRSCYFFDSH